SLEVQVLELDATNRRLALSHKHMEENPWDTFETIFTVGSLHKSTIISKNDKGAVLELPYGIEGFCSAKNLVKQDESKVEVGEAYDFKVLEFSKEERRIVLSLKATWSTEVEKTEQPAAKKKAAPKGKSIDKINQEAEKSTLGDIEALSALKEKMSAAKKPTE
ncbi:MAG TPA: S1 RNA-binding domain-containing protein, partial [Cyclobacteriaceae bacterium]|nr:S1 RNA-binding domain-containing protein [Cyclobacteriaceae bacterium]